MGGVDEIRLCEPIETERAWRSTEFDKTGGRDTRPDRRGAKAVMGVDELRRGIEAIPEARLPPPHLLPALAPLDRGDNLIVQAAC